MEIIDTVMKNAKIVIGHYPYVDQKSLVENIPRLFKEYSFIQKYIQNYKEKSSISLLQKAFVMKGLLPKK